MASWRSRLLRGCSNGERFALAGAVALLALQALGLGPVLEYRRQLLFAEPWRLLTGHLVHTNLRHALVNALAWVVLARLFAPELGARRQALTLLVSALSISGALALAYPGIAWYRGLSGALHGLFAAGAVAMLRGSLAAAGGAQRRPREALLAALLLAALWLKIARETWRGPLLESGWLALDVVTPAHLAGAAVGTLLALGAWRRPAWFRGR